MHTLVSYLVQLHFAALYLSIRILFLYRFWWRDATQSAVLPWQFWPFVLPSVRLWRWSIVDSLVDIVRSTNLLYLLSLTFPFSADPNITDLATPKGTPQILAGIKTAPKSMTLDDLWARFKVIYSLNGAKMAKCSLVITSTSCIVAGCIIPIRLMYSCADALTCLLTYLLGSGSIKPEIYPKRLKIERKFLLTAYIKSYNGFRLPPKWMTSKRDSRSLIY